MTTLPAVAGLAVGISFIITFALLIDHASSSTVEFYYTSDSKFKSPSLLVNDCNAPASTTIDSNHIDVKKRTWISVSRLAVDPSRLDAKCTIMMPEALSEIPKLERALEGADGCMDGTEVCQVSYGISAGGDSANYELTISKEEAEKIANEITITKNHAILAHAGNFYFLEFHTIDSDEVDAQIATEFVEPVSWQPVALEPGQSLEYTILIKTWATYGGPAEISLDAQPAIIDSGLSVRFEPGRLTMQERSEARVKMIIAANEDVKGGIYDIFAEGSINNSSSMSPCGFPSQCPAIQIGGSAWEIRSYGSDTGLGMGGKQPPEWLRAEVKTDKEVYSGGEDVQLEAYIVNDGQEKVVLEGARFFIQILDVSKKGGIDYIYSIDAMFDSDEQIVIEPKTRVLLARPFQWDQKTFSYGTEPHSVANGSYAAYMAVSGYEGHVLYDNKKIQIGGSVVEGPESPAVEEGYNGITIVIPEGISAASPSEESLSYYIPEVASVQAGSYIRWENKDFAPHMATSGSPSSEDAGVLFDTAIVRPREFSQPLVIDQPGEYPYYCVLHPWMTGTIIIGQA